MKDKISGSLEKFSKKKWFQFLFVFFENYRENDVSAAAAETSYYLILSIFPFIIFFLNILSKTVIVEDEILESILIVLPTQAKAVFEGFVSEINISSSDTLLSLSFIILIWSSSKGVYALVKAINKAYGFEQTFSTIKFRILSLFFTIILSLLILVVLGTLVFGELIGNRIFTYFNATHVFIKIWNRLRILIPLVAMIVVFTLLYKFSVSDNDEVKITFKETIPGAIFTTLGWLIYSAVFSFYVNNFGNYSATYGSLGGIIILLAWMYMTCMVIILGGEVNASYREYKILRKTKGD